MNHDFETVRAWLDALRRGEPVAILSTSLAAAAVEEARGWQEETIGSLSKKLKDGQLEAIKINGKRYLSAVALAKIIESGDAQFNRAHALLIELAKRGKKTTYGEIMAPLNMSSQNPPDRNRIGYLLGQISRKSWTEDGIFLSALVHRKGKEPTSPGPGYIGLIEEIAPDEIEKFPDEPAMVMAHMKSVWRHYLGQ